MVLTMTLKEELEILRGEPIPVFDGDSIDIPCIETSDSEKLCKHPVVSVHMMAYNHAPYIRQAIEGVMMQKTDFEFELVIGEDCSKDKTREICFEYQKKYPDKIRVLWWYENVSKIGGNERRTRAHCRGEFIAICEGDDYWVDPLKLQKQVDVMRKHPNVGLCFTGARIYHQDNDTWSKWNDKNNGFSPGFIESLEYVSRVMFGSKPDDGPTESEYWQMTATLLIRNTVLRMAMEIYDIFTWQLLVGDSVMCLGVGSKGDVYYIPEDTVVYRITSSGITKSSSGFCNRDTILVRMYYFKKILDLKWEALPQRFIEKCLKTFIWTKKQNNINKYIQSLQNCNSGLALLKPFRSKIYIQIILSDKRLPYISIVLVKVPLYLYSVGDV